MVFVQTAEKGKAVASSDSFYAVDTSEPVTDWQDYSNYYDEYDDDEEVGLQSCCILCHTFFVIFKHALARLRLVVQFLDLPLVHDIVLGCNH